jgi:hypothetical protein
VEFFVPNLGGPGTMPPGVAELAWTRCVENAKGNDTPWRLPLDRRIRRLRYVDGKGVFEAVVGEIHRRNGEMVMCIVAFAHSYVIACESEGYLRRGGESVSLDAVRSVEEFDMPARPPEAQPPGARPPEAGQPRGGPYHPPGSERRTR